MWKKVNRKMKSPEKKRKRRVETPDKRVEMARRVAELRAQLGVNNARFAARLGVNPNISWRWERGKVMPATEHCAALGNLAAREKLYSLAAAFWQLLGVDATLFVPVALDLLESTESPTTRGAVTMVPPVDTKEGNVVRYLAFPSEVLKPNTLAIRYIVVENDDLLPLFKRGDLLIVDVSEIAPAALVGSQIVITRHTAPLIRRGKQIIPSYQRPGFYAGWLRASGSSLVLDRPNVNGGIESEVIFANRMLLPEIDIVGRVVSWIDMRGKPLTPAKGEK